MVVVLVSIRETFICLSTLDGRRSDREKTEAVGGTNGLPVKLRLPTAAAAATKGNLTFSYACMHKHTYVRTYE